MEHSRQIAGQLGDWACPQTTDARQSHSITESSEERETWKSSWEGTCTVELDGP